MYNFLESIFPALLTALILGILFVAKWPAAVGFFLFAAKGFHMNFEKRDEYAQKWTQEIINTGIEDRIIEEIYSNIDKELTWMIEKKLESLD